MWQTFRHHLVAGYEIPKYDGDLGRPNLFVDIDEATLQRKIDLLQTHFPSQHDRTWWGADTFRAIARLRGIEAATRYAEAFYCRKIVILSTRLRPASSRIDAYVDPALSPNQIANEETTTTMTSSYDIGKITGLILLVAVVVVTTAALAFAITSQEEKTYTASAQAVVVAGLGTTTQRRCPDGTADRPDLRHPGPDPAGPA